ncbi:hypothetical protein ACFQ7W_32260 [Streptomyces niveus]|uniref:hypothetical protein n=1 Tax=Streptomyces niveus TaxID=193462 RepID=UPI0036C11A69
MGATRVRNPGGRNRTCHTWAEERADTASPHRGAPPGGQRQGEVREGPVARVGVPVFAILHGYADLAATGMLTPELAEGGLGDVIAFILRGCAPDARA